jgi:glycosyltransferase involved in cell wall biosynthesis
LTESPSIVIRAFNEERHIGRLLAGIMEQTAPDPEIILIDSGSTDATLSIAKRFPVLIEQIEPEDFTFGRALNLGCSRSAREVIVVASAHVYPVYPDWLRLLMGVFDDPGVALAYGKQRGDKASRFSESQHFAKMYPSVSDFRQTHPLCNNANAAIRRSLWQERPYDESLPGLEDLEWAAWAVQQGYHLAYVADAEVVHVHDETPLQVYNRYRREAIALRRMRPSEHFNLVDFLRLFLSNVASDGWHALREGRILSVWSEIIWFRLMQFLGTLRGFSHRGPLSRQLKEAFYYPRGFRVQEPSPQRQVEPIQYGRDMDHEVES